MAANTLDQPRVALSPLALLAWSTIVGGVMTFALGVPLASFEAAEPPLWWVPVLNVVSHLLLLVGVVGLVRSGAAGRGRLAASGLWLTILGLALNIVAEFAWLIGSSAIDALYGISALAITQGLILAGVAMVRGGRWTGWHRITPLACGLYVPLVLLPAFALPDLWPHYAIGAWGVCWLLLGVAQLAEATPEACMTYRRLFLPGGPPSTRRPRTGAPAWRRTTRTSRAACNSTPWRWRSA